MMPPEGLRARFRRAQVSRIGLHDPDRSTPHPLNDSGGDQQDQGICGRENDIRDSREQESSDDCWTPSDAIGEATPEGRRDELGDGKCRDERADRGGVGAEVRGVVRQQWDDHRHAHCVDKRGDEEGDQRGLRSMRSMLVAR
jgi:hypothetical protein